MALELSDRHFQFFGPANSIIPRGSLVLCYEKAGSTQALRKAYEPAMKPTPEGEASLESFGIITLRLEKQH